LFFHAFSLTTSGRLKKPPKLTNLLIASKVNFVRLAEGFKGFFNENRTLKTEKG
jgi:hypothetical protein